MSTLQDGVALLAPEINSYRGAMFFECPFSSLRFEGAHLFAAHWLEASADRSVPLAVNWEIFEALERGDQETCIAVRVGSLLIGYAVYIWHEHLHYSGLRVAESDAFFLRPADREGWLGVKLFQVAEAALKRRGIHEVWQRAKLHVKPGRGRSDLGPLFEYLGYRPVETIYRKRIG